MCGISVIYRRQGGVVSEDDLQSMSAVLEHRGPDEAGLALLNQGRVGLAHVRLSIIDLESGQQPLSAMAAGKGNGRPELLATIVFNGELYDYQNHRADLIRRGHQMATQSDTEVLLHLYLEYGVECFSWINGEFAFVIWDARHRRLIAARDRMGVKPLFVHERPDEVLFASEVKSLFALPRVEREWNPDYFVGPLFGAFSPRDHVFSGIEPLPAGHWMSVEEHGRICPPCPYWEPKFRLQQNLSLDEAAAGVRDRLTQAVSRRMVADVPIGSYLSGGLDSTLICGLMSQLQPAGAQRMKSFNIGFGQTIYDESTLAERIARHYGVHFETIDCSSERLAENFETTVWHVEMPLMNPNSIAKQILSRLVRDQGYKVCLTGEGADEVFGGYPYFKQELLWNLAASDDPHQTRRARQLLKQFTRMEKRSEGLLWSRDVVRSRSLPNYLKRSNFQYSRMLASRNLADLVFTPRFRERLSVDSSLEYFEKHFDTRTLAGLEGFNATQLMTFQQLSQYIIPALGDRVEMANSVECRTPFLDCELIEFASQVPTHHFMEINQLKEKNLLRVGFESLLPEFMSREHKHPFLSPNWRSLAQTRAGRELFADLFSRQTVESIGIFQLQLLRKAGLVWKLWPQSTLRWRRYDILFGLVASTHLLHRLMIESPQRGRRGFRMVNRTPENHMAGQA